MYIAGSSDKCVYYLLQTYINKICLKHNESILIPQCRLISGARHWFVVCPLLAVASGHFRMKNLGYHTKAEDNNSSQRLFGL